MQTISKPLVVTLVFTMVPATLAGYSFAQNAPQDLPGSATFSGVYSYNFSSVSPLPFPEPVPFALSQTSYRGGDLSLISSGASLTLSGQGSIEQTGNIGGISQLSVGIGGANGAPPQTGGNTGTITTSLSNVTLNLDFTQAGWRPDGLYGLSLQSLGPMGGNSTSHDYSGAPGGAALLSNLTINNSTIKVITDPGVGSMAGAAILVEQAGGAGGAGHSDMAAGLGGAVEPANVTLTDTSIGTVGDNIAGVIVSQSGGSGGQSVESSHGGTGGSGSSLTLTLSQSVSGAGNTITTAGNNAPGIGVSAAGGRGTDGGDDGTGVSFDVTPGNGRDGGNSGASASQTAVTIQSTGLLSVTTSGDNSVGIGASSRGGDGGNGGEARGIGVTPSGAGSGGRADPVLVSLEDNATITTKGSASSAILATAQGGRGGNSGIVDANASNAQGQNGGPGGIGGFVTVTLGSGVTLNTAGDSSNGITAISSGGNAGDAGDFTGGLGSGHPGNGGRGGDAHGVTVTSAAAIVTAGETARGILVQAQSGGGGSGGNATGASGDDAGSAGSGGAVGNISVTNSGTIKTAGGYSQGILAQSISGSGGAGGNASGSPFHDSGGRGASGVSAGMITLGNTGAITTLGESAQAIIAQSIGGDGGVGGTAGGMISVKGGTAGNGGAGGNVQLTPGGGSAGILKTYGTLSHAIVAQSIGGGGGIGGNVYAAGLDTYYAVGGSGGAGGTGGTVTVAGTDLFATTAGSGAIGLLAQSVGGSGGAGGAAYATDASVGMTTSSAVGGSGGGGGAPGTVEVTLSASRITTGSSQSGNAGQNMQFDAPGVLAQSIGGSGGVGGGASAQARSIAVPIPVGDGVSGTPTVAISHSIGGSGGNGGSAVLDGSQASIGLSDGTEIATYGTGSSGAQVQSIGGGGGQGGDSSSMAGGIGYGSLTGNTTAFPQIEVNVSAAVGGMCGPSSCAGGDGGDAEITVGNNAAIKSGIKTYGDFSVGSMVQSIGGGGGNAGIGSANTNTVGASASMNVGVTVGTHGGGGGNGGTATATINADGFISTSGMSSTGLLVQSVGGGGGVGSGGSVDISPFTSWAGIIQKTTVTPTITLGIDVNLGAKGGAGGDGNAVTVTHAGLIGTKGKNASGIIAQSVGGGGGVGGTAGVAPANSAPAAMAAVAGGAAEGVSVPLGTLSVTPTLSIGGSGGSGGAGGPVTVNLSGGIATNGDFSPGMLAQSIGGGGGLGGLAVAGGSSNSLQSALASLSINSSISLGVTGGGGVASHGGDTTINLSSAPEIITTGAHAPGILAQSIGGGGGAAYDGSEAPSGSISLGMTLGTAGGAGGNGGTVHLTADSADLDLVTQGDNSHGIFLQSVGGGGGIAATGSNSTNNGWAINHTIAGQDGVAGNGGDVTADLGSGTSRIYTSGVGASGLIAQSVGGGGGMAAVAPGLNAVIKQFGTPTSSIGAGYIDGGDVSVTVPQTQSLISTSGIGAHAIIAQSIGGGGGLFTGYAATGAAPQLTSASGTTASGNGSGGDVTVDVSATLSTTGAGAFGVLAQSVAGGGGIIANNGNVFAGTTAPEGSGTSAGNVTVTVGGAISATGENSIGVFAQSSGDGSLGSGAVTVNVNGTVEGGTGAQGVGILVAGGNSSNQINIGAGGWVWGQSGSAIRTVGIWGQQKVDVSNEGQIYGNTWLQGGSIDGNFQNTSGTPPTAASGTLTNSGMLVALPGKTSYVDGHLIQTAAGWISPHLDYSNMRSGDYVVTGNAVLNGSIRPNLASAMPNLYLPTLTVSGDVSDALTIPDSPLFSYTLQRNPGQFDVAITGTHFDGNRFGLNTQQSRLLRGLESVFASGDPELGPFFARLDSAAGSDSAGFRRTLHTVAHRNIMAVFARAAADSSRLADTALNCQKLSADRGVQMLLTETSCIQASAGGYTTSLQGGSGRDDVDMDSAFWQFGGQSEVRPNLFLGGLLAYKSDWLNSRDGVSARGSSGQGAATLKYQAGALLFTGALFGSVSSYEIERAVVVPGFSAVASSSPNAYIAGVRGRVAYTLGSEEFYLRPSLSLDLIHARSERFSESGAGGLGLRIDEVRHNTAVVMPAIELGGQLQLSEDRMLHSYVSGGVQVRSADRWKGNAAFKGGSVDHGFSLDVPIDQLTGRVSAGLQLFTGGNTDIRVQYDGEFGRQARTHGGAVSLSYRF